jgi:hypothetical protein
MVKCRDHQREMSIMSFTSYADRFSYTDGVARILEIMKGIWAGVSISSALGNQPSP